MYGKGTSTVQRFTGGVLLYPEVRGRLALGCHLKGVIGSGGRCFYFLAVQMRSNRFHGVLFIVKHIGTI